MHKAMDVALETDLRAFMQALNARGIAVRATEESGRQILWVRTTEEVAWVQSAWQRYQSGEFELDASPFMQREAPRHREIGRWQRQPVTLLVLALCLLIFVVTWLLQDMQWLAMLSFEPLMVSGGQVVGLQGFMAGWSAGEYWRLVTPALLHFGVLHLVFNALWWWELARRIEWRRGSAYLASLLLCSAVVSNASQYIVGRELHDPGLFGGLSGVIYALIGYIGVWNTLRPTVRYDVPRGLIGIMLGFLLVCMTGVMEWVGLGRVANAAHVGGLLAGAVWGLGAVLMSGKRNGY
ncbi:MAG TPA: rhomboid family intramembrane serine protease [Pseudomonadales bacterium]